MGMAEGTTVTLTEGASRKVLEFFARDGIEGNRLRIEPVRTHCMGGRGYQYNLGPSDEPKEDEEAADSGDITVVYRREDLPRLRGVVIDYKEGLDGAGFAITNPQAVGKCPCGHHDLFEG
jgi:iron-sulfur cluster assembly protein